MILSILALAGMAGIAYMSAVMGVYRAALTLVACVLAGVIGFGLMGPLAGLLGAGNPPAAGVQLTVWYFVADAICLWAVFAVVFLALRTAGEKYLKNQPEFPRFIDRIGGFVLGTGTGYLTMGLCMILVQMLPTAPDALGYEAFTYTAPKPGQPEKVEPTSAPLLLKWDRGTLEFFGYLSTWPLGSDEARLFNRYGHAPLTGGEAVAEGKPVGTVNDFLYYHWYRRYEFIQWRTGRAMGPIPEQVKGMTEGPGTPLGFRDWAFVGNLRQEIVEFKTRDAIDEFQGVRPGSGERFVLVTVRFQPRGNLPAIFDTDQFELLVSPTLKATKPRLLTAAKPGVPGKTENSIEPEMPLAPLVPAAIMAPRNPRFSFHPGALAGECMLDGVTFKFTEPNQVEVRTLVFNVRKEYKPEEMRLSVEPNLPQGAAATVEVKSGTAKPPEAKGEAPKAPPAKPAVEPKPPDSKPAPK